MKKYLRYITLLLLVKIPLIINAQGPPPPPPPPPAGCPTCIPIDQGAVIMILVSMILGAYQIYRMKKTKSSASKFH